VTKEPSITTKSKAKERYIRLIWNPAQLAKAILKGALSLSGANPLGAADFTLSVAEAACLKDTPENRAWILVFSAIARALGTILNDYSRTHSLDPNRMGTFIIKNFAPSDAEFVITSRFFVEPAPDDIVQRVKGGLREGLLSINIQDTDVENILARLPNYVTLALHNEWASNPSYYELIEKRLKTPFSSAVKSELNWSLYRSTLQSVPDEHVFDETFSLRQIYIHPRAYFREKQREDTLASASNEPGVHESSYTNIVVDLDATVRSWLTASDPGFTSLVLSGGPGSGKSSYAKVLASSLASAGLSVLFVPLHQLDVDRGVASAISAYLTESRVFAEPPLNDLDRLGRVILILDGLDELQMQGKAAQEAAQGVIEDLLRYLDRVNSSSVRILAIITGREMAVQATEGFFRSPGQVLHLLPYCIEQKPRPNADQPIEPPIKYSDPETLLEEDQRDIWWRKYGELTGRGYTHVPEELRVGELGDVTSQPLLNYLVALTFGRGGLALTANTNINLVYRDLLEAVHERSWAPSIHPAVRSIPYEDFVRLLEEVALSVWHGAGRATTLREVEEHCEKGKVKALLPAFEAGASAGVSNLLLAFYFRQKGRRKDGEKTFEFTHKTFAEYLTALRAIRTVKQISSQLEAHMRDSDTGWDEDESLARWTAIFGPSGIDHYLRSFVRREIAARHQDDVRAWLHMLVRLMDYGLAAGWPMSRFGQLGFGEQQRWQKNAEAALLICLNACARVLEERCNISWPLPTSFGDMLKRLQGQRSGGNNQPVQTSLSHLNLDKQIMHMSDFYFADLRNCSFRNSQMEFCNLVFTNLSNCDLRGANIAGSLIDGTNLQGARLSRNKLFNLYLDRGGSNFTRRRQKIPDVLTVAIIEDAEEGENKD
jgi:hypothetical protein